MSDEIHYQRLNADNFTNHSIIHWMILSVAKLLQSVGER